jgi:hypothetical protein
MITFFSDFRQFSAKKMAFFSQNQCYDPNFAKTEKRQFFAKYLKIITAVPVLRRD